jgi:hypothetical protein
MLDFSENEFMVLVVNFVVVCYKFLMMKFRTITRAVTWGPTILSKFNSEEVLLFYY